MWIENNEIHGYRPFERVIVSPSIQQVSTGGTRLNDGCDNSPVRVCPDWCHWRQVKNVHAVPDGDSGFVGHLFEVVKNEGE